MMGFQLPFGEGCRLGGVAVWGRFAGIGALVGEELVNGASVEEAETDGG